MLAAPVPVVEEPFGQWSGRVWPRAPPAASQTTVSAPCAGVRSSGPSRAKQGSPLARPGVSTQPGWDA